MTMAFTDRACGGPSYPSLHPSPDSTYREQSQGTHEVQTARSLRSGQGAPPPVTLHLQQAP